MVKRLFNVRHTILKQKIGTKYSAWGGIATLTKIYVDKLKGYDTKLLDTRKTARLIF
jgi:nicotinate-nucleotide pyrophosphorylase